MADLSDVETALTKAIVDIVYPGGITVPSVMGKDVKVYRGWPAPLGLNADLASQTLNVSVFSDPKMFRETTRYPQIWRESTSKAPTLTVSSEGASVIFGGYGGASQVAGVRVGNALYSVTVRATDTPISVAAALSALIPGSRTAGSTLTVDGGEVVLGRVAGGGTSSMETRRQEQGFTVSLWCNDPITRDALASLIDGALSLVDWLEFADGSSGQLRYHGSTVVDTAENASLYRRDLTYSVDYPTVLFANSTAMLFGIGDIDHVAAGPPVAEVPEGATPLLGAIRFDAWYDPQDVIDQQCASALSSPNWINRLPPNANVNGAEVTWPLADQMTFDAEIRAATAAGLSYWAFDSYQPADGLSRALNLYLSSSLRSAVQFCMLGQSSNWADPTTTSGYSVALQRDVSMMSETGYLTVLGGRPVYFVLDADDQQLALLPAGGVARAIATVREQAVGQGLGDPYVIWLSGAALADFDNVAVAQDVGADAAGAYACPRLSGAPQPYSSLVASTEQDWVSRGSAGLSMVATAMTGWDQRPLIAAPQPFYPLPADTSILNYYESGDAGTIAAHISRLRGFIVANPIACRSGLGLVYAWNELVEGGWLMPTYGASGSDDSRVQALQLCSESWGSSPDLQATFIA
jgi:hypothetical protein